MADFFEETRDLLTGFELAGLNALHLRSTLHQKYNFLSLELARAVFREYAAFRHFFLRAK